MFPHHTRILIADDSKIIRQLIRRYFTDLGYDNLEVVDDGEAAWERLRQAHKAGEPFELILSGFSMPKLNGLVLLKQVRSQAAFRELPFILIASESDRERAMEAHQLGVSEFVIKPFSFQSFAASLQGAYRQK